MLPPPTSVARHRTKSSSLLHCVQFGVLVGNVQFPPPANAPAAPAAAAANGTPAAAAPAPEQDLATALIKAGLGRTAEWGLNMMTTGAFKLRELGALCSGRLCCAGCRELPAS